MRREGIPVSAESAVVMGEPRGQTLEEVDTARGDQVEWRIPAGSGSLADAEGVLVSRTAVMKACLAGVSLLLVASMGGGFLALPLLVPLHLWAARRSGPVGRMLWSLLPVTAAAMVTWAAVYVIAGESKPAIWLFPLLAAVVAGAGMVRLSVSTSGDHR